jgi:glycosyltransferase involved in cell wall biosynthesis
MKPSATVAIITRTKDRPLLLARALKSVLSQTSKDWLHVIINDGGDAKAVDELVAKSEKAYANRILVIHNKKCGGMEAASNKAIAACESEYVVVHDDDDAWHKNFLKDMVSGLKNYPLPSVAGIVCHSEKVVESIKGKKVTEISREPFNDDMHEITLWGIAGRNRFSPISFLYKREVFKAIGGMYDESLPVLGDWEFNLRFLQQFDIAVLPQTLAYYYFREQADGEYANTVTGWHDKHLMYSSHLRNKLLRDDLAKGKFGLGLLVNASKDFDHSQLKQDSYLKEELRVIESAKTLINDSRNHADQNVASIYERLNQLDVKSVEQMAHIRHLYAIQKPVIWVLLKLRILKP